MKHIRMDNILRRGLAEEVVPRLAETELALNDFPFFEILNILLNRFLIFLIESVFMNQFFLKK